jgi:hypothetical protein
MWRSYLLCNNFDARTDTARRPVLSDGRESARMADVSPSWRTYRGCRLWVGNLTPAPRHRDGEG